jgi:hypothetical protein
MAFKRENQEMTQLTIISEFKKYLRIKHNVEIFLASDLKSLSIKLRKILAEYELDINEEQSYEIIGKLYFGVSQCVLKKIADTKFTQLPNGVNVKDLLKTLKKELKNRDFFD